MQNKKKENTNKPYNKLLTFQFSSSQNTRETKPQITPRPTEQTQNQENQKKESHPTENDLLWTTLGELILNLK